MNKPTKIVTPCPFCGLAPSLTREYVQASVGNDWNLDCCIIDAWFPTYEMAVEAWETRQPVRRGEDWRND